VEEVQMQERKRLILQKIEGVVVDMTFPSLSEFEFDTVTIADPTIIKSELLSRLDWRDRRFEFETAKLEVVEKRGWLRHQNEIVIAKSRGQATGYVERLDGAIGFE
jgi:hypothetical protein